MTQEKSTKCHILGHPVSPVVKRLHYTIFYLDSKKLSSAPQKHEQPEPRVPFCEFIFWDHFQCHFSICLHPNRSKLLKAEIDRGPW